MQQYRYLHTLLSTLVSLCTRSIFFDLRRYYPSAMHATAGIKKLLPSTQQLMLYSKRMETHFSSNWNE